VFGAHDDRADIGKLLDANLREVAAVGKAMKRTIDVRSRFRDHIDFRDMEFRAWRVAGSRSFAAQVVADDRRGQSAMRDGAAFDYVAQVDITAGGRSVDRLRLCGSTTMRLLGCARPDHQQAHVGDEIVGQFAIGNIVAGNVEAKVSALDTAAVAEVDFEVELDAMAHRMLAGDGRAQGSALS
jgi:hypothetical protein